MTSGGRRKSIAFFIVLGVCLVAGAVALNVGWVILNWREAGLLIARPPRLSPHHHRRRAQHHLPGPRNPPQRAARRVHQRRHARAEDAGRVDEAVPPDAAEPRRRRGQAAGVLSASMLQDSDRLLGTIEQVLRAGQLGAQAAARQPDAGRPRRRSCEECLALARTRHHLPPGRGDLRRVGTSTARRSGARRRGRPEGDGLEPGRQRHQVLRARGAGGGRARAGRSGDGDAAGARSRRRHLGSRAQADLQALLPHSRRDARRASRAPASGCSSSDRWSRGTAARCSSRATAPGQGSTFIVQLPVVAPQ